MKKLLIAALLLGGVYFVTAKNKSTTDNSDASLPSPGMSEIDTILSQYDNMLVSDQDGFWFLVKNGKLYTPATDQDFYDWQKANPNRISFTAIPSSIWKNYNAAYNGGSFTATT